MTVIVLKIWITQYFLWSATGVRDEVCSLNTSCSCWLLGPHACCSLALTTLPTSFWANSYASFISELTGYLGRWHTLNKVYSPLPHASSAHCSRVKENSAYYTVHSSQLKIIYLFIVCLPQLTVNSLKVRSISAFLNYEVPNIHCTEVWGLKNEEVRSGSYIGNTRAI